ncbi:MAG TPA: flagellar biosynthetic protein FliR [Candidatus Binatia bacterium]|nr:flagellar biosynthetic protein FliR [Candidatus Binatia bacterium]
MTELLVLARCVGFVFRAPGFSHPSVPAPLRAGFALLLAMAVAPGVRAIVPDDGSALVVALAGEFLIGGALGMAASLLYDGAYAGGRVVDDYVGVRAIAPSLQLVAPSGFGRVWSLALTGAFFLTGAYRLTLVSFAQSFARMPPGAVLNPYAWGTFAANFATGFADVALQIAAPAVGLAFVVQVAFGALSRVVPRFGSFTLAFPLAFAAAIVMTAIAVPEAVR